MKRLSIRLAICVSIILVTAGAWAPPKTATAAPKKAAYTLFFFYTYPNYDYLGCESVADAESELLMFYGYLCDQNPAGGTLVGVGYMVPNPSGPASVKIYAHFPL